MEMKMWSETTTDVDTVDWRGNPIHIKDVPAIKNLETGKIRLRKGAVAKAEMRMMAEEYGLLPRDIVLLLMLYAKPGPFKAGEIHYKYQLNKALFYQWKKLEDKGLGESFNRDEFGVQKNGPVPINLWDDLRRLEKCGLVILSYNKSLTIKLTDQALKIAEDLWNQVWEQMRETTLNVKETIFPLKPKTIKKKVHREYPDYKLKYTEEDTE